MAKQIVHGEATQNTSLYAPIGLGTQT